MANGDMLILKSHEVLSLLQEKELEIIDLVRMVYRVHSEGDSSLPHSSFLRFPNNQSNRIIAMPAYLGDNFRICGIKWIASFPNNLMDGLGRASALIVLNSINTGWPEAILEGSIISAKRTAASAALAAEVLHNSKGEVGIGLIGCGSINFEILRFLLIVYPHIKIVTIFDIDIARANEFRGRCLDIFAEVEVKIADDVKTIFKNFSLISIATTAAIPHIFDLSESPSGSTILHISLRDLSPEVILKHENIVDDVSHVCRAQTSLHLAEQQVGNQNFIRCTLGDILLGKASPRKGIDDIVIFSPFGLGILDIALSKLVLDLAREGNYGTLIESFMPINDSPQN
jgi:N-[(2S)-2-amino-2-carboxyethyl]-L-glutamate dehydrogenase